MFLKLCILVNNAWIIPLWGDLIHNTVWSLREFRLNSSVAVRQWKSNRNHRPGIDVQHIVMATNSLVKVEVQLCDIILAAYHQGLLQSLQVLHLQVLAPISKCFPLHFFQKSSCLAMGVKNLLTSAHLWEKASFLKHLDKKRMESFLSVWIRTK